MSIFKNNKTHAACMLAQASTAATVWVWPITLLQTQHTCHAAAIMQAPPMMKRVDVVSQNTPKIGLHAARLTVGSKTVA
jgi:hypothetical protein